MVDREYGQVNHSTVETELTAEDRRRAARCVAGTATDARDCAMLLDALGLTAEEGLRTASKQRVS